jgi:dolichol-phosphate mannosyltransferase
MITVLLPVYNEQENIGGLLDKFIALKRELAFKIVIVNDGSRDRSREIIQSYGDKLPITLINHPVNKGVTEALKTGFSAILQDLGDNDLVITMDSDNSHDPASIKTIIEKLNAGYDLINGSRYCLGGKMVGVPVYRLFFSYSCKFILTRLFPMGEILDYSVFYRGYRGSLLRQAFDFYADKLFQTQGFVGLPELLIKLRRFQPKTTEVPLVVRYDLKKGTSKMKIFQTLRSYARLIYIAKRDGL